MTKHLVEFKEEIEPNKLIETIIQASGLGNIEEVRSSSNFEDVVYFILQRVSPVPEKYSDIPELSSVGTNLLMKVWPFVTNYSRNFDREKPAYTKYEIFVSSESKEKITPEIINQAIMKFNT